MKPTLDQLKGTLSAVDDSQDYVLILKTNAHFELIQGAGAGAVSHLEYVTRWSTFDKGNGGVGESAASDSIFTSDIMDWASEAWEKYEDDGRTKILNPFG
ncbi:hypothetical protein SAMN04487895_101656 [Paenibacillus sophorae]|uniref:Uncharacterized protein n=1 Tax=Paenibacillus sophorae TaxID=1333845 RepID=A0A1H8GWL0_9BACL|nr:hypothetical protein [Paenibacillus sophorae]QWU14353.1 hypothetical protein KP014_20825 [Paenibacillus sophorae]SEN47857.1 hypothetical protein SAMN04487895_101656 [Paenibacillus sophorae]